MRTNTQTQWIAQAEARYLGETALSQRARLEPPIGVVWAEPPLWREWMHKTLARLAPTRSCPAASRSRRRKRG